MDAEREWLTVPLRQSERGRPQFAQPPMTALARMARSRRSRALMTHPRLFRPDRQNGAVSLDKKSEQPLKPLDNWWAFHAEGRGFESRRSRQSFQWLSPRSRGRICFCPGRPPRDRRLRAASVPAASPRRRRFEHDCVPHQGVAIASHGLRRCGLIHFRAKTHCCLTHSLACAFLCAALRDESSFPGANPLDFGANRRFRPAQNRRMGGMFLS
jgi:hypothetical protein